MINVTRSSMPDFDEYIDEIRELWDTRWLTNSGVKHKQLEAALSEYLGVPGVTLYTNGHLALEAALAAMDFPVGGEVITTPFTFASTTHAIVRNGLVPVFCDVNESDYTIDTSKIEALITEKTCAIVPVHVYGNLCDVEAIKRIASLHSLRVIYDAAHAFGVTLNGVSSAAFGDASMFSFHATKVFNTIEGGALCYSDSLFGQRLNEMKNFGIHSAEEVVYAGNNAKMNEFQAAMGICNLRHLDGEIEKRRQAVLHYTQMLGDVSGIKLNTTQPGVKPNYAYFPVVFDGFGQTRDEIFDKLAKNGYMARKYFYPLTNSFACYKDMPTAGTQKTPVADYIAQRVLTLPLYAGLSDEIVDGICDVILSR